MSGKKMQAAQPVDLTAELAEVLRWREMEWSCIPPLSRKLAMPYLGAGDTINLDTAVTNKEDRKHLVKSYVGLRSAGLDGYAHYRVDDDGVCLGVRWAQKRSIDLRNFRLEYKGYEKWDKGRVLYLLVHDTKKELATYFATRCDVRDFVFGGESTLIMASERGYLEIVQTLLMRGADVRRVNDNGFSPISHACHGKHIEVLRALVEAGGDVNTLDSYDRTALHNASWLGFTEGVRYLVERGADMNKSSRGGTPLTMASFLGRVEVVRALLEAGADVNKRDSLGRSPLSEALKVVAWHTVQQRQDKAQTAVLLREAGAQEPQQP